MNTELRKHGAKVINRVRRGHSTRLQADARRDCNRRQSEADLWRAYAETMAKKQGIIPDVSVKAYLNGRTVRFFRLDGPGRWRRETDYLGEWTIPDRVWTYSTTLDQIAAEEWTPVADQAELAECLA